MMLDDRVNAVAEKGFTPRQARFLVTVMEHAGVCVPRQYARFAGTAYGHTVTAFFSKLVQRGYAVGCDCAHNRAQLYHVRHQALYRAIGIPESRYRRPVSARQAIERVMLLDAILVSPELIWLGTEDEKVSFFRLMAPSLPVERLPHSTVRQRAPRLRLFPENLPIGVEPTGRAVFLYLVTTSVDAEFRTFVQSHSDLLRALPGWALRLVFSPEAADLISAFEVTARDELTAPFSPEMIAELKWYFEQCRSTTDSRARSRSDERFWEAQTAFSTPRCRVLYRRWMSDGDSAFELVSSPAIADALARGAGRIESCVLPHSYRHLFPLVGLGRSSSQGVEEGDRGSARPQPLHLEASASSETAPLASPTR